MGQRGSALGIVLLLMLGLSALALAGYGAAVAALALAGLEQSAARAFEAAEAGAARALRDWPDTAGTAPSAAWPAYWHDVTTASAISADPADWPAPWPEGFSIGGGDGTFAAHHYTITSEGRAPRATAVRIEQGFLVIEPAR